MCLASQVYFQKTFIFASEHRSQRRTQPPFNQKRKRTPAGSHPVTGVLVMPMQSTAKAWESMACFSHIWILRFRVDAGNKKGTGSALEVSL